MTNGKVLDKLQSYHSRISVLGPEAHCIRLQLFQKSDVYFMSMACGRPQGEGSVSCGRMWTRRAKNLIFCARHKWMTSK